MKKLLFLGLFMALIAHANAQTADTVKKSTIGGNNELRLNMLYTVLGLPEINYERIISNDMGVGIAIWAGLNDDTDFKFGVIPHFRIYFGAKKASGFFIEANTALLSMKEYEYAYTYYGTTSAFTSVPKTITSFGLGAAAGGKFLTKSGFVGEAYFGLGRLFNNDYNEIYPRLGITIGKRF